jgi:acyl-ACP thioesterase
VELLALPERGRVFRAERPVRLGDVAPDGRMRLDAVVRFVQDVSGDDSDDAAVEGARMWVVRRTVVEEHVPLRFRERVRLATTCSGYGSRWAERRVSVRGDGGGHAESVTLWVHVDGRTFRPAKLGDGFLAVYGEACGGRVVDGRLRHDPLVAGAAGVEPMAWTPRATDLDLLDHVNNTIAWALVEQAVAVRVGRGGSVPPWAGAPRRVEVEHRDAIGRDLVLGGRHPVVLVQTSTEALRLTVRDPDPDGPVHVTALVRARH